MKPIRAKWMIEASDYIKSNPGMISRMLVFLTFLAICEYCTLTTMHAYAT